MEVDEQALWKALRGVKDPEHERDITSLNMVSGLTIDGAKVSLKVDARRLASNLRTQMESDIKRALIMVPGVKQIEVDMGNPPASAAPQPGDTLKSIKHIIAVASAKGGVGKSTVSVNLAASLAKTGARVGLLDADIYGPNVPLMTGVEGAEPTVAVYTESNGRTREMIEPIIANGLKVMSMGFLVRDGQPIMWRGPMLNSAMKQFLGQVDWGELDYLVIDLPPGTGDVQISLLQLTPVSGIVHVTTPQEVALQDVRRGIAMFAAQKVPILGVIENMSFFRCPHCNEETDIFSHGGSKSIIDHLGVPLLATLPLDRNIREAGDTGTPMVIKYPESEAALQMKAATDQVIELLQNISPSVPAGTPN